MRRLNEIPEQEGYYWVKLQPQWEAQIIEYIKGIVYVHGSRERFSPYEDVYQWYTRVEGQVQ